MTSSDLRWPKHGYWSALQPRLLSSSEFKFSFLSYLATLAKVASAKKHLSLNASYSDSS